MTREQFNDIQERLAKWREERGLSVEDQKKNFYVNYTKELVEYFESRRDNNEYEMIDALCDMIIVAINAGGFMCRTGSACPLTLKNLTLTLVWKDIKALLFEIRRKGYNPYLCLLETIKELDSRTGYWSEEEGKWIKDLGAYTKEEAREVAKNLLKKDWIEYPHSVLKKGTGQRYWQFVSEDNFEIKEWYKADYSKCKND